MIMKRPVTACGCTHICTSHQRRVHLQSRAGAGPGAGAAVTSDADAEAGADADAGAHVDADTDGRAQLHKMHVHASSKEAQAEHAELAMRWREATLKTVGQLVGPQRREPCDRSAMHLQRVLLLVIRSAAPNDERLWLLKRSAMRRGGVPGHREAVSK